MSPHTVSDDIYMVVSFNYDVNYSILNINFIDLIFGLKTKINGVEIKSKYNSKIR